MPKDMLALPPLGRRQVLAGIPALGATLMIPPAWAAVPVGEAVTVTGQVEVARADTVVPLVPGASIELNDRIVTRQDGLAMLMLEDKSEIHLGSEAEILIDAFVANQRGVMSVSGPMLFNRPEDLSPTDITIRSAFAQIGVRGTRFFAGPTKGKYSVFVDRGSVSVEAAGVERILVAGEGVEFEAEGSPPGPVVVWGEGRIAEAFASVGVVR